MSKWVLTIPFVAGEDKKKGLLRINNLMRDSAKAQGFQSVPVKPKRPASQLWQQLESTGTEQRVTMEVIQPGQRVNLARARRTFTPEFAETVANYEFATGDDELDAVFQRIMPELSEADLERMSNATSARARAFDASIDSLVGADTKLRNRHINASDKFLKSYIIGHAPARAGATLTENRKRELQDIVKASLGNLGVQDDDMSELLRHRIQSRPILMSQQVEIEFRAMIHAYHEVRKHNAPFIQAMMGGMDGAKDPEGLISALLPSPDDIMRGAIAHIILDLAAVPSASQTPGKLRQFVDDFAKALFNLEEPVTYIGATDKQKEVGRLLAFHGGRKRMVAAVEKAVNKAQLRGADFIKAFRTSRPATNDADAIRGMVQSLYSEDGSFINLKEENMTGEDSFFGGGGSGIFVPKDEDHKNDKAKQREYLKDLFKAMQKEGLAFPISQFRQAGDEDDELGFVILPIELPMFTRRPVGWDRRWMVATMRVVDEYWDFIYSGEGILLSNLLYLIVARAEELFQYTMDSTEITQLAILLSKDSSQFVPPPPEAPAAPGAPAPPAAPASSLSEAQLLKIRRTKSSLKNLTKPDLQELLDAMGVAYDKGRGARGYGGDTKPELVRKILDNRSRFARRRSRRGGILPTPKDSGTPAIYRPLKTLSHLVTGQVAAAAAAVQGEEASREIERLQQENSEIQNRLETTEAELARTQTELAEESAEADELEAEAEAWEGHDRREHLSRGERPHAPDPSQTSTIVQREEEMDSGTFRDEANKLLDELDALVEATRTFALSGDISPSDESTVISELDKAKKSLGDKDIFPSLSLTVRILGPLVPDSSAILNTENKLRQAQPKRRGRRKNASKLGTIYTEASVPRSRNTAKHIKTAMGELYADLYKTAKNDFKGADSVENIGIEMINIGNDIFHLVAKADVMSDTKSNPPFGPFKKRKSKVYAGRFNTLDEITQAMDKMRGNKTRFNKAYKLGNYGNDEEARWKLTRIFYEITDGTELARDIELSLAALTNPPYDMEEYRIEARNINRQEIETLLERAFDPLLKEAQQQDPNATFYKVKLGVNDPKYNEAREILSRQGLLVSPRDYLKPQRVWYSEPGPAGVRTRIGKVFKGTDGLQYVTHSMEGTDPEGSRHWMEHTPIKDFINAYTPRGFTDAQAEAMRSASYFAGNYGKMTRITFSYNDPSGKGSIVMDISDRPPKVRGNPPDTCCIICGSCDDPCDCEDNPPKGTFKEKETRTKVKKILRKEGGAAGLEPLRAAFPKGTTKKAIERFIDENIEAVYQHEDGDYILESKKKRKYKGHLISKVSTGWMVEAYDQSFKTLKQARDFISKKVAGSATANQQCVRILKGTNRCKGMVVFIRSKKYKCDGCGAEYREA